MRTCQFGFTGGEQTFAVPVGVTSVQVTAVGADGGNGNDNNRDNNVPGGEGGAASAPVTVIGGATVYVEVGGRPTMSGCFLNTSCTGGFNGGGGTTGQSGSGGGGGASDVRTVSTADSGSLASRLVVAAGGGGGGSSGSTTGGAGGDADTAGKDGDTTSDGTTAGGGGGAGTTTSGGAGGSPAGQDGSAGQGGTGGDTNSFQGGGGGGGYNGGGGGGGNTVDYDAGALYTAGGGGGGGASFAPGGTTGLSSASASVTISYTVSASGISTQASPGVTLGSGSVDDSATVTGSADPQGSITFTLYGPDDSTCTEHVFSTSVPTDGSATVSSDGYTPTAAGVYRWIASYSGDDTSGPVSGSCGDANESVTVAKAGTTTAITSDDPDPSDSGQALTVDYTVTSVYSGATPTGNVTVSDGNNSCTGSVGDGECDITLTGEGTHQLTASYSGDGTYAQSTSVQEPHTVIVKPTAPLNVSATAGNTQAAVSFDPPVDNGGSDITSYTVTATDATNPARGGQTRSGSGSPITITSLTNGDTYTFTVTATNGAGTGPVSDPSNAVTPTTAKADLSVKLSGPVKAADGTRFTDTITVTNAGPTAASNVSTYITVPSGLTVTTAAGSKKVGAERLWTLSSLAAHGTQTYKITYKVAANTHRSVTLTAGTGARTSDPNTANNTATSQIRLG